jgi:hypothetical protein
MNRVKSSLLHDEITIFFITLSSSKTKPETNKHTKLSEKSRPISRPEFIALGALGALEQSKYPEPY